VYLMAQGFVAMRATYDLFDTVEAVRWGRSVSKASNGPPHTHNVHFCSSIYTFEWSQVRVEGHGFTVPFREKQQN